MYESKLATRAEVHRTLHVLTQARDSALFLKTKPVVTLAELEDAIKCLYTLYDSQLFVDKVQTAISILEELT